MQSMNSKYESPYLAVYHVTFTNIKVFKYNFTFNLQINVQIKTVYFLYLFNVILFMTEGQYD